jgi:hypothetical protein
VKHCSGVVLRLFDKMIAMQFGPRYHRRWRNLRPGVASCWPPQFSWGRGGRVAGRSSGTKESLYGALLLPCRQRHENKRRSCQGCGRQGRMTRNPTRVGDETRKCCTVCTIVHSYLQRCNSTGQDYESHTVRSHDINFHARW